jgi:hypothetical protein
MGLHSLATSTRTVEMLQVIEINDRLATIAEAQGDLPPESPLLITAELLGLTGATVHPRVVDRPAAAILRRQRQNETLALPAAAALRSILAAGDPSFPYLYGVFGEPLGGRRRLPAIVHTEHLKIISVTLDLRRHRWGL